VSNFAAGIVVTGEPASNWTLSGFGFYRPYRPRRIALQQRSFLISWHLSGLVMVSSTTGATTK